MRPKMIFDFAYKKHAARSRGMFRVVPITSVERAFYLVLLP